jgi:hypothetical protein
VKHVETYFERRRLNREYRSAARRPRPTMQDIIRCNEKSRPQRLTRSEYNPERRVVYWPRVLQSRDYCAERAAIDSAVASRTAGNSDAENSKYGEIVKAADKMLSTLKTRVNALSPTDYVEAKRFLLSLKYEMRIPQQVAAFASR